jgi:hypothetical protein
MAYLLKNNCVFYHIPKTGGTWVRNTLRDLDLITGSRGMKHDPPPVAFHISKFSRADLLKEAAQRHRTTLDERRDAEVSFCFVRHPLRWYESWFKYMSQPNKNWKRWRETRSLARFHPVAALDGLGAATFEQFIENVIRKCPGFVTEMYSLYSNFVVHVGKQESIRADLLRVLETCDLASPDVRERILHNEKEHVSPPRAATWDPSLKQEMLKLEYPALVRYGYAEE